MKITNIDIEKHYELPNAKYIEYEKDGVHEVLLFTGGRNHIDVANQRDVRDYVKSAGRFSYYMDDAPDYPPAVCGFALTLGNIRCDKSLDPAIAEWYHEKVKEWIK